MVWIDFIHFYFYGAIGITFLLFAYALQKSTLLKMDTKIQRLQRPGDLANSPFISIIIPARNEAHNIVACLKTLLDLDYPHYEVIVAEDGSTDGTMAELKTFQSQQGQFPLRIIPLPQDEGVAIRSGWASGKTFACWHGAQQVKGDWLLFIDADTRQKEDVLWRIMTFCELNALKALSSGAIYRNSNIVVELFEDIAYFTTFLTMPLKKIFNPESTINWVTGHFIFIERQEYLRIGTHEVVKSASQDDMALGKVFKQKRVAYQYLPAGKLFYCWNYRAIGEAVSGWARLIACATPWLKTTRWTLMGVLFAFFFLSMIPGLVFTILFFQKYFGPAEFWTESLNTIFWITAIQKGLITIISLVNRFSMKMRLWPAPFAPVGAAIAFYVYSLAYRSRFHRRKVSYRGRPVQVDG